MVMPLQLPCFSTDTPTSGYTPRDAALQGKHQHIADLPVPANGALVAADATRAPTALSDDEPPAAKASAARVMPDKRPSRQRSFARSGMVLMLLLIFAALAYWALNLFTGGGGRN